LYINVTGVSSEILKNLVLAGVKASICDARPFPDAVRDTPSFLLPPAATTTTTIAARTNLAAKKDINSSEEQATKKVKYETVGEALKPVVEDLNLLLGPCEIVNLTVADLIANGRDQLMEFPIVVASRIVPQEAIQISKIVAGAGNKFFMADCFGLCGASAMDLGEHSFRPEMGKKLLDPISLTPQIPLETMISVPLQDAVNRFHKKHPPTGWMKYRAILEYCQLSGAWPTTDKADDFAGKIQTWIQNTSPTLADHEVFQANSLKTLATVATAEVAPICAVLGGILGNEVIKAISGKGEPANNTILFDGETCKAWTFCVRPNETK